MKPAPIFALCAAVLLAMLPRAARAQDLNLAATPAGTHVVSTSAGLENAFVARLGYGYAGQVLGRTVIFGGDFTLPWVAPDSGDYRLRVGALIPLVDHAGWRLSANVMPVARSERNFTNRMFNLGLETDLLAGYYAQRWFAAAELGADWAALTHIESSAEYRKAVYAGARDGWYASTGATFHAGLVGGYSFGPVDVVLRVGQTRDAHLAELYVPLYATLGANVRLPF